MNIKRTLSMAFAAIAVAAMPALGMLSTAEPSPQKATTVQKVKKQKTVAKRRGMPMKKAEGSGATIYGVMTSTDGSVGIYSTTASSDATVTELVSNSELSNIKAGTYVNGTYYALYAYTMPFNPTYVMNATQYAYDTSTWECETLDLLTMFCPIGMAFNPVDNTIYMLAYNDDGDTGLYTYDTTTAERTEIAILSSWDYSGLACDSKGTLYTLCGMEQLETIDAATGEETTIGSMYAAFGGDLDTGSDRSLTFDLNTGELYLFASTYSTGSGLYKMDLTTGEAELITNWNSAGYTWQGTFCMNNTTNEGAPGAITNLEVSFVDAATDGTVSFQMPDQTFGGTPIVGQTNWNIEVDGTIVMTGAADAGATVTEAVSVEQGLHTFKCYAENDEGKGAALSKQLYVGNDTPKPTASVTATLQDDGTVAIAWEAITEGVNAGYLNTAALTYNVMRLPDSVVVASNTSATSCTDTSTISERSIYQYEVTATAEGLSSDPVQSAIIALGDQASIPFSWTFSKNSDRTALLYTIIDANNDGITWNNFAQYGPTRTNNADDWIITPPLRVEAKRAYKVTIDSRAYSSRYPQKFEVKAGFAPTVEGMTLAVIDTTVVNWDKVASTEGTVVLPDHDGPLYVGVHVVSDPNTYNFYLSGVKVELIEPTEAPAAGTLAASPTTDGAMTIDLKAVAPTKQLNDSAISETMSAVLINKTTGDTIYTASDIAAGQEISATDNAPQNGLNEYSMVYSNHAGEGMAATAQAFAGVDVPGIATNVHWTKSSEGRTLTWDAPTEGQNGYYINPDDLTYNISIIVNGGTTSIATGVKGNSYEDLTKLVYSIQVPVYYEIRAVNSAGTGRIAKSNSLPYGDSYACPFFERFEYKGNYSPWIVVDLSAYASFWNSGAHSSTDPAVTAVEGADDYMLTFEQRAKGEKSAMQSPWITLEGVAKPVVRFMATPSTSSCTMSLEASKDGDNWETLVTVPEGTADEWSLYTASLDNYKDCTTLMLRFVAEASQEELSGRLLCVDQIKVCDDTDCDLRFTSLYASDAVKAGTAYDVDMTLTNDGSKSTAATVNVYDGDSLIGSADIADFASDSYESLTFHFTAPLDADEISLRAEVVAADDSNADNNTIEKTVSVTAAPYAVPTNLTGKEDAQGPLTLSWTAPAEDAKQTVEDFENLESWTIGGIDISVDNEGNPTKITADEGMVGNFKVIDADHYATYWITSSTSTHNNQYMPMAGTVFDLTNPTDYSSLFATVSGHKSWLFITSQVVQSNDYLILPRLADSDKTISFEANSADNLYGLEKIEILYSTTDNSSASFQVFKEAFEVPYNEFTTDNNGYTHYEFTLPSDAKYAAIHYISNDVLGLFVDDICYAPYTTLVGYNVYRDGHKLNSEPIATASYTDAEPTSGSVYTVTAVYEEGESTYSDPYAFTTGIATNLVAAKGLIRVVGHTLSLQGFSGAATVYTADGRTVATVANAQNATVNLHHSGVYMVKTSNGTSKVVVR